MTFMFIDQAGQSPRHLVKDWQILAGRAREGQRASRMTHHACGNRVITFAKVAINLTLDSSASLLL